MEARHRIAGVWVSDLTAGFVSWLEDCWRMWQADDAKDRLRVPRWALLGLLFTAAVFVACAFGVELAGQRLAQRRLLVAARRQAARARRAGHLTPRG